MKKFSAYLLLFLFIGKIYSGDLNTDACSEGMAGANIAGTGSVYTTSGNAAGLAYQEKVSINMTYRKGLLDMNKTDISIITPLPYGVLEIIWGYRGYGEINNYGAEDNVFNIYEMSGGIGYGMKIAELFSLGCVLDVVNDVIDKESQYEIEVCLSGMYKNENTGISILIKEIHRLQIAAGLSQIINTGKTGSLKIEADGGIGGEEEIYGAVGGEYSWNEIISIRSGYRIEKKSVNGLYTGLGLNFAISGFNIKIDYALSPKIFFENDTEWTHTVSFRIIF